MRVLLDTHILLWMIGESRSLSDFAMHILAAESNELFFSSISIAEVAIKHQKNAALMPLLPDEVRLVAEECGIRELVFDSNHAVALATLPQLHRDPFDRMLIAQAQTEGMKLLSHDRQFPQYGDFVIAV